jgi:hypothetical protein
VNLEHVRALLAFYRGAIKAWALRENSFYGITEELGFPDAEWSTDSRLFDIPVVVVTGIQPEGVIV